MNIAVMGYGTVGSGVVEIISKKNLGLTVTKILDLRDFPGDENESLFTKDFNDIVNDETIGIVVETMGGLTPAFDFVSKCLMNGKHVVTSNKELVAERGLELLKIAKDNNVNFMFEASVGGGIPIIRPISVCLVANDIKSVNGILNGTTNFILTKMIEEDMSFDTALKIAQDKGYAEKDPTADVEGHDACRKICILAALSFGNHIYPKDVHCEGITKITLEDVAYVKSTGASIKLIGTAQKLSDGKLYMIVSPAVVKASSQLSSVNDVFNAVCVNGDATGEVVMYGKGAGKLPTASAVVADVMDCNNHLDSRRPIDWESPIENNVVDYRTIPNEYYIRLECDKSELSRLGAEFGQIKLLWRENAPENEVAFITEEFTENDVREKLEKLGLFAQSLLRIAKC